MLGLIPAQQKPTQEVNLILDPEAIVAIDRIPKTKMVKKQVKLLVISTVSKTGQDFLWYFGLDHPFSDGFILEAEICKEICDVLSLRL